MNFIHQRITASQILQYFNPDSPEEALELVREYDALLDDQTQPFETRKMPTLRETIYSTIRLKKEFQRVLDALHGLHKGIVLGGSMSYGPFLIVREDSDLDLIILSDNPQQILQRLSESILPAANQRNLTADSVATIVSFKGDTTEGVNVSAHIFSPSTLALWKDRMQADFQLNEDTMLSVLDSKNLAFSWPNFRQRGFDGSHFTHPVIVHTDPFLYHSFVYAIEDTHLYCGMYLNLMAAPALCFFMEPECLEMVTDIRQMLQNRLEVERTLRPTSRLLQAHVRWEVISQTSPYIN